MNPGDTSLSAPPSRWKRSGWWIPLIGFGIATSLLLTLHWLTKHMTDQLRGYGADSLKSSAQELFKHLDRSDASLHQILERSLFGPQPMEDLFEEAYATLFNYHLAGVLDGSGHFNQKQIFGSWSELPPQAMQAIWQEVENAIRPTTPHSEGLFFIQLDGSVVALYALGHRRGNAENRLVIGRQLPKDFIPFDSTSDVLYRFVPTPASKITVIETWNLIDWPVSSDRDDHRPGRMGRPEAERNRMPRGRGGPPPGMGPPERLNITRALSQHGLQLTDAIRTTEDGKTKSLVRGSLGEGGPILEILVNRGFAEQLDRHARAFHWIAGGISIAMVLFTIVVVRTMRQRQLAEAMLQTRNEHLDLTNQSKDRLLSIIAHDLRAPLTGVTNLSGLLARKPESFDPADIKQYAGEIQSTSKHLSELLENLLNWARLQTGQLPFYPGQINLDRVTHQIKALFHSTAMDKGVTLDWRVHVSHPIHSDVEMLRTLLRNMVSNAIRHTASGGQVILECHADDRQTVIEVRDTGEGMSAEQLQSLFQLPDKPRDPTEVGIKGAGFGMVLCYKLAQRMGGSLKAASQKGQGTTVTLCLPTKLSQAHLEEPLTHPAG